MDCQSLPQNKQAHLRPNVMCTLLIPPPHISLLQRKQTTHSVIWQLPECGLPGVIDRQPHRVGIVSEMWDSDDETELGMLAHIRMKRKRDS